MHFKPCVDGGMTESNFWDEKNIIMVMLLMNVRHEDGPPQTIFVGYELEWEIEGTEVF